MAVFFTSLLPQFAHEGASLWQLLPFGIAFGAMTLAWLTAYALAVAKARTYLLRSRVRRILDAVMGAVFVALGARVATQR
jgi:threonine/homoserine/homoserine lactone efflux protein